jgi:tRNA A37 threonylcarbamoyladenosine modification protein TsaB
MLIAGIEASTERVSAVLMDHLQGELRVVASTVETWKTEREVRPLSLLADIASSAGLSLRDIGAYVVGLGPGPGVGLEPTIFAVRSLALTHRRPLAGASSLQALVGAGADHVSPVSLLPMTALEEQLGLASEASPGVSRQTRATSARLARLSQSAPRPRQAWATCAVAPPGLLPRSVSLSMGPSAAEIVRLALPSLNRREAFDIGAVFRLRPLPTTASA